MAEPESGSNSRSDAKLSSSGLQEIFQGIYSAIVSAQNTIEMHYLGEITEDYFDVDGSPKMVHVTLPDQEGKLLPVQIPAITLVPHNGLKIKEVSLEMKVRLSQSDQEDESKMKKSKIRKLMSDLSNRGANNGKDMATLKVIFEGCDPPEGLARIKDSLVKFIPT